jgi:hypothetical protein
MNLRQVSKRWIAKALPVEQCANTEVKERIHSCLS